MDWSASVVLETEKYTSRTRYDALNRPIQLIAPHIDQPDEKRNVIQPVYNEANLLEQVHVWLESPIDPEGLLDPAIEPSSPVGVTNIGYNAKGQRLRITYSNGASTFYEYDALTFRLIHLLTLRDIVRFSDDCPQPPITGWPGCQVQNLYYTYDPVGNISIIRDDAQQRIFFRNMRVEPSAEYSYDATYRLIKSTGREHLGQVAGTPMANSYNDVSRVGLPHPNDGRAMGTYTELYTYDAVGNILKMQHLGADLSHPAWTRSYVYKETSLIEDGTNSTLLKTNNRLSNTLVAGNNPSLELYEYDNHGNITKMPQLQIMQWDYNDQLHMTQRQKVNDHDENGINVQGERTYYIYDSTGRRVRKITELASGNLKDEHIYLTGFELYRCYSGRKAGVVRESLHITEDEQRIAMVETRTRGVDDAPAELIRYQFSNHLGSSVLELDDQAQIISYEEYTPYGEHLISSGTKPDGDTEALSLHRQGTR